MDADWPYLMPPTYCIALLAAILGACIGSFLTLVTYRLPRDEKIGMTRSRCPSCGATLFNKGRCRTCRTRVSMRYPLTELACAAGAVFAVLDYGVTWEAFAIMGLCWCIVAITVTDLEHTIILDEVQVAVGIFGVIYGNAIGLEPADMFTGAIAGLLIGLTLKYGFLYLRNKDALGLGDVKFLCVAGIWLGSAANFIPFLFFSGILGIISGVSWQAAGLGPRFPFGPALAVALFLAVIAPQTVEGFWTLYGLLH